MRYCVRFDKFEFNLRKNISIREAFYSQADNNTEIKALFETFDEAKAYIEKREPSFHKHGYTLGYAEVWLVTECDWYFDDDYYRDENTGKIERNFSDLELFDDVIFKASEELFKEACK